MTSHKALPSRRLPSRSAVAMTGIVLALLLLSAGVGLTAGLGRFNLMLLVLAVPLAFVGWYLVTHQFGLLVLALPLTALAVPISFSTGSASQVPLSMALVLGLTAVWVASMALRGWKLAPSPINRPLLAFAGVCVLSLVWGIAWRDPVLTPLRNFVVVQIASLLSFLLSFSAALLIGNFVRTPQGLKWIVGAFLVFGTLMLLTQLLHIRQGFLNDRGLWALWLVAPVYGLIIAQPNLGWRWRAALIGLLVLTLYQTMVAQSLWVSGWAPGLAAIVAITFLRSRKAFLVLAVVGGLALYASQTFFQQVAIDNINEGSLERIAIWEQSWGLAQQHWLFGTGPAGYAIYYITYYRDDARSTHNNYLDILAQFGVVGMLLWLWFVLTSLWEGWRLVQRAPPGIVRTLAIVATGGWFGAMASMMFGDWILPFAYNQTITGYRYTVYSWIFLGMLISIRQILSAPPPEPAAQTL